MLLVSTVHQGKLFDNNMLTAWKFQNESHFQDGHPETEASISVMLRNYLQQTTVLLLFQGHQVIVVDRKSMCVVNIVDYPKAITPHFSSECCPITQLSWKMVSMIRKYHNHKLQTNSWLAKKNHNNQETTGRQTKQRERSGSSVECLTRDRRAAGSSLTGVIALWSLSKTHLS